MDPASNYKLEVRIISNYARFNSCYRHSTVVDSDLTNFKDLMDDTLKIFPCGYGDVVKLFYFCAHTKSNIEIRTDQDLLAMFAKHKSTKTWTRSQFNTICKVDYVTNNVVESCNHWVQAEKGRHLDDLMDALRQKLMIKWNHRRKIARQMEGKILKHIVNDLIKKSHNLDIDVVSSLDGIAEVRAKEGSGFRFVVNLDERTCSCRAWQVSGIPCKHALAFITSFSREKIEDHVDMYYSVEKFRAAYEGTIPALPDKSMWPKSDHGWFLHPPLLKSTAGRKRNNRFKGPLEGGSSVKGKHQCPICKKYGHHWYTCKDGDPSDIAAMLADRGPPKKKQKKSAPAATETSIVPVIGPARMVFPAIPNSTSTPSGAGNKVKKSKKTKKTSTASTGSSVRSTAGFNQPSSELLPIPLSMLMPEQPQQSERAGVKGKNSKPRNKKEEVAQKPNVTRTPAMSTRSKLPTSPDSPAMGTRSKRKLNVS